MTYTIKKIAQLSGVSVRTLHFYDEIGLLKPAYTATNGYRYYKEEQLLTLQQILFFRELGFELKQIQKIVSSNQFDKEQALHAHKEILQKKIKHLKTLLGTIDKTVNHLQGKETMNEGAFFKGFNSEKQKEYENYLIEKYGMKTQKHIEESKQKVKSWGKEQWQKVHQNNDMLMRQLTEALQKKLTPTDPLVQELIGKHYEFIQNFWTPTQESYKGLSELYNEHPDFKAHFEAYHPDLAQFLAQGMQVFAKTIVNKKDNHEQN